MRRARGGTSAFHGRIRRSTPYSTTRGSERSAAADAGLTGAASVFTGASAVRTGGRLVPSLLGEVAALHGAWAASPDAVQTHIWKHARVVSGSELAQPVIIQMESGPVLGIAGDGFHPAGGVEGAYLSGLALAARCSELLNVIASR